MAKKKTALVVPEKKEVVKNDKTQMKELYQDFRDTLKELLGDTGDVVGKHKGLILLGFLFYLWNRNRTFSIEKFVKEMEQKLVEKYD